MGYISHILYVTSILYPILLYPLLYPQLYIHTIHTQHSTPIRLRHTPHILTNRTTVSTLHLTPAPPIDPERGQFVRLPASITFTPR